MKKLLAQILLIADSDNPNLSERLKYAWNAIWHFAPIAFVLDLANWWFKENSQFGSFMCIALVVNMLVGAYMHRQSGTFTFKLFLFKNIEIALVICTTYIMLEMIRYTAGNNLAGEVFRDIIQVMTLLYPVSKVLKNLFIITKGKYPPEFIMRKLYNFEKNGDLGSLFSTKKEDLNLDEEFKNYKEKLKNQKDEANVV